MKLEQEFNIINNLINVIDSAETIQDENERLNFLKNNIRAFEEYKNDLSSISRMFFIKGEYPEYIELSDNVKRINEFVIRQNGLFESFEHLVYYKESVLTSISDRAEYFVYNLQFAKSFSQIEIAFNLLEVMQYYERILEDVNFLEGQSLNESAARRLANKNFEKNLIGHSLMALKSNSITFQREEIKRLLDFCNELNFFENPKNITTNPRDFYNQNLTYQYIQTIIKLKSIFSINDLSKDELIIRMWNGEITDLKVLKDLIPVVPMEVFANLLDYDESESKNDIYTEILNHFPDDENGLKYKTQIFKSMLNGGVLPYNFSRFYSTLPHYESYIDFLNSEDYDKYPLLHNSYIFDKINEQGKKLENLRNVYLSADFYLQVLDRPLSPNMRENQIPNLFAILKSNIYSDEDKKLLLDKLKEEGFEDTIPTVEVLEAKEILSNNLETTNEIDINMLKACLIAVARDELSKNGIDIKSNIFFGDDKSNTNGEESIVNDNFIIWINTRLLNDFIESNEPLKKTKIFETMFHEMRHCVQDKTIREGEIDFSTYNYVKEKIIRDYDEDFYEKNYRKIFIETDARIHGSLGAFDFIKTINPVFSEKIKETYQANYLTEINKHTIYKDSSKKAPLNSKVEIDISEYLGRLIQENQDILEKNPILNIEYNLDGTKKDILTMLNEFNERSFKDDEEFQKIFSIYYGVISNELEKNPDFEITSELSEFLNKSNELISLEDMHFYYHTVEHDKNDVMMTRQIYSTYLNIFGGKSTNPIKEKGKGDIGNESSFNTPR